MNADVDREIENYKSKFENVQGELTELDQQIAVYENMIC